MCLCVVPAELCLVLYDLLLCVMFCVVLSFFECVWVSLLCACVLFVIRCVMVYALLFSLCARVCLRVLNMCVVCLCFIVWWCIVVAVVRALCVCVEFG